MANRVVKGDKNNEFLDLGKGSKLTDSKADMIDTTLDIFVTKQDPNSILD